MKKSTGQDIEEKKMAEEYVQCTLQTDTRQQMRYKKIGEEIHGKRKGRKSNNKNKNKARRRWVSKHG